MVSKKCQLCSKLSYALDWLSTRFSKSSAPSSQLSTSDDTISSHDSLCVQTNKATEIDTNRVQTFSKNCPDCICEKFTTSPHSPGLIKDSEKLTRFVFSPVHLDRKGRKIKPSVFSHVSTVGCSVQRESIVSDEELVNFVKSYLGKNSTHLWHGILTADCNALRDIILEDQQKRIVCVYDMAEEQNRAHAEIHQSQYEIEEADRPELRAKLFEAFNNGINIEPAQYRNGSILANFLHRDVCPTT